jgi:5-formyltetrahydrofolate cyclo-ligase
MQPTIRESKQALRNQVRVAIARMEPGERMAASAQACALLEARVQWRMAQWVLFYAPLPQELDVWPLLTVALSAGKKVALPRFVARTTSYEACQIFDPALDSQAGQFGIREPHSRCAPLSSISLDLILVPGVAFDLQGRRLGRGNGYYDQLLKGLRGTTCGVAFDQQIIGEIPVEPHDAPLDYVLTPTRWIELSR